MKPKMYLISIEYNSKTYQNLINTKTSYLQILNINQSGLVKVFGKKSGTNFNKNEYLERNKLTFKWKEGEVLKDCCAYLKLKKNNIVKNDADHAHCFRGCLLEVAHVVGNRRHGLARRPGPLSHDGQPYEQHHELRLQEYDEQTYGRARAWEPLGPGQPGPLDQLAACTYARLMHRGAGNGSST